MIEDVVSRDACCWHRGRLTRVTRCSLGIWAWSHPYIIIANASTCVVPVYELEKRCYGQNFPFRLRPCGSASASLSRQRSIAPRVQAPIQHAYILALSSSTACEGWAQSCSPGRGQSRRPVAGMDIAKAPSRKCQRLNGFSWSWDRVP